MQECTDATLTKTQKNRILKLIREFGPPPEDFTWKEKKHEERFHGSILPYEVSVLEHRPTRCYCIFGVHDITTSPGIRKRIEDFSHEDDWGKKESICGRWLVDLREEVEAPDFWASIGKEKLLPAATISATIENDPFTVTDQRLILAKLDEIHKYVLESRLFAVAEMASIEKEFAYLKESAQRQGRKDWLHALLGGLVGLLVTLALEPERAKGLLRLAGVAVQSPEER